VIGRRQVALAGHLGDDATARRGLDDPDASVRATALGALWRLAVLTLDEVATGLSDAAAVVRARAAELAGGFGPAGIDLLVAALTDSDPSVVEAACFGLGETSDLSNGPIDGPNAVPPPSTGRPAPTPAAAVEGLVRVSREHPDPICREAAVAALGALGSPAGLEAILAATEDKPAVRRRAVLALASFSGPEVDSALQRALGDRDWQVRQAAEDMTGRTR
jgi:HEAT repeat protein